MSVDIGRLGIWTAQFDFLAANQLRETVAELEELGYSAIWFGENVGRETVSQAGLVLSATKRITVATGIQNIWLRDPLTTVAAQNVLSEAYPGRFLLGLGVGHARLSEGRGRADYARPLTKMREYLLDMDQLGEKYRAVRPAQTSRVLSALGPRMLALAAEMSDGAHPYFVPPEHTAQAREILGPDKLLAVEQAVVLETDPVEARAIARLHVRRYLPLPNYTNNLRRLGFTDSDFEHDGSDKLVDAIVAWGDLDAIATRIQDHWDAGADHVCINVISPASGDVPTKLWRRLSDLTH